MLNIQFNQAADAVTERFGELTNAPALVVDDRGIIIASSERGFRARPLTETRDLLGAEYLRLPIRLHGQCGEVILAEPANGEVLSPRLAQTILELVISQTLAVAGLPDQHELKNKFIHDLLHGLAGDEADIRREGQILGMDLTRPRAVILIDTTAFIGVAEEAADGETNHAQTRRRSQLIIDSVVQFFHLPNDMICAYVGDGEVAILKASSTQDLAVWADRNDDSRAANPSWADLAALKRACTALVTRLQADFAASINIGIGRYHPGIAGIARSYQDARTALSLAERFHGPKCVHCLDELGVAAFIGIADEPTKIDLARQLLSPLDSEPELFKTLQVFFANNCSPSQTANRLAIHRNTLALRFNKINLLTGLDPHKFDDSVQIHLALLLRSPSPPIP
jgi:carbohydrate diacid regulator